MTPTVPPTARAARAGPGARGALLVLPLALYTLAVFVVPLALLVRTSFAETVTGGIGGFTLEHYERFFTTRFYWQVLFTTLVLSLLASLIVAVFGVPYAYGLLRRPRGRAFFLFALIAPLLVNQVVRVFGLQILINSINTQLEKIGLPQLPFVYSFEAVLLGQVLFLFPFMVIAVYSSLGRLPLAVEEAAATLGASRLRVFLHVVLPAARPGIIAGFVLTFTTSTGAYLIPRMLGGGNVTTVPLLIYNDVSQGQSIATAAVVGLVLTIIVVPILRLGTGRER